MEHINDGFAEDEMSAVVDLRLPVGVWQPADVWQETCVALYTNDLTSLSENTWKWHYASLGISRNSMEKPQCLWDS